MHISYFELSKHYPFEPSPCSQAFRNQCAIRLSIALQGAGFSFAGYAEPLCEHGHARGAESLANFLWRRRGRPEIYDGGLGTKGKLKSRQGIIPFKDIKGFRDGDGDHIDIWHGSFAKSNEFFERARKIWFFNV